LLPWLKEVGAVSPSVAQEPNQTGLSIPDTVDAPLTLCLSMNIPNDPTYIEHVLGTLAELGSGWLYQSDTGHNAALVAQKWKTALQTIQITEGECMPPLQLRACTLDCGIEYSTDGGDTWTCISLENCISDIFDGKLSDALQDGTVQGGTGQQGPQSPPAPGVCRTYHVRLNARDQWHCPSPVSTGDTIQISNAVGGWFDGSVFWRCPDGSSYALGGCDAGAKTHVSGDPLNPGAYHMALIGKIGATYFDPLNSVYTVPAGITSQDLFIQANDGSLSDNMGEVEFDIAVCTGVEWCYEIDFTASNGSFVNDGSTTGTWVNGVGWQGQNKDSNNRSLINIKRTISASLITYLEIEYDKSAGGGANNSAYYIFKSGGSQVAGTPNSPQVGNGIILTWSGSPVSGTELYINVNSGTSNATTTARRVKMRGRGVNPFGGDNCT
jgi:hypothetical protein